MIMQAERNRKSVSEIVRNAFLGRNMILQGCRKMRETFFRLEKSQHNLFILEKNRFVE